MSHADIEVDFPANHYISKYEGDLTSALIPSEVKLLINNCKNFQVAIHAGGGRGSWPKWLSLQFGSVYTFQPYLENFMSLLADGLRPNIYAMLAMLGEHHGPVTLIHNQEPHTVPMFRIDDLALSHCDAIIIDVVAEEEILKGAKATIKKFNPIVMVGNKIIDYHPDKLLCHL